MDIDSINFLPAQYRRKRGERRRLLRHVALLAALAGCLGPWWSVQRDQTAALERQSETVEAQVFAAREQMKLVVQLRAEHATLERQMRLVQGLAQPVSHGQVLATLARHVPDAVVFTRLDVTTHRTDPTPTDEDATSKRRGPGSTDSRRPAGRAADDRLQIEFDGLAPDDLALANLIDGLKQHVLFQDVKLHHSRSVVIHGVSGRQFRMTLNVPLNRNYQPATRSEEIAHAD